MSNLDFVRQKVQSSFDKQGFLQLMGAQLSLIEPGKVTITCAHRTDLTQQNGFFHAGIITTLADVAAGYAAYTVMPPDADILTVEFKTNFIRPGATKMLVATGEVLKPGKFLVVAESIVWDEKQEKIIAKMVSTLFPVKESPPTN